MRVLHVVEVTHGGVVTVADTFAGLQARRGLDVHVLAPPGVTWSAGTVHAWQPRRRSVASYPSYARRLREVVAEVRPDVVHLHSFFPGVLGRMRPMPAATTVVYQPHSWAFEAAGPLSGLVSAWERRAARRTDRVVTNCEAELAEARAHGLEVPADVIGLPLDTDAFLPVDDGVRSRMRERVGVRDERLLVTVGRISRQKGQDQLVRAWERSPLPGTVLAVVGPGDPASLQALAPRTSGSSLRFVGPRDDVRPWLHAADLYVQPSRYEGQSVAMAEAMSCGRSVVITDVNGAREAVAPQRQPAAGAVVPLGDMDAFLDACRDRLDDDRLRQGEQRVARSRAVAMFGADGVTDRLLEVYAGQPAGRATTAGPRE